MRFSNQGRLRQQVRFSQAPISSGRCAPLQRHSDPRLHWAGASGGRGSLEGPHLHTTDHAMGVLEPGVESRPFVSWNCRAPHRSSSFSRRTSLPTRDRCLLSSQNAITGKVLFRDHLSGGTSARCQSQFAMALEGTAGYMFDGTTVIMPDTAANQKAYPQAYNQKPGLVICPGDVLLTDCLMANWLNIHLLQQRGIEFSLAVELSQSQSRFSMW
jgi:hypothetical protein